jgi:transcriptional regulator with GAF, ATPase, and Fis domain
MIRQTLKQAVDKNELKRRQVNENITMAESIIDTVDVSMFFQEVDKVETSINDVVSSTKLNYIALPIFVPGDLTLNTVGMLKIESTKEKKVEKLTLSICQQYSTSITQVQTISSSFNGLGL